MNINIEFLNQFRRKPYYNYYILNNTYLLSIEEESEGGATI